MKTFVVLSDTHGRRKNVEKISALFWENDYVVHLGDGAGDMRDYCARDPEKFYVMKGNCDFVSALEETVIEAEGVRIFCCHGHKYGVKSTLARLAARAKELDCTLALYGHTHRAGIADVDGVLCVNPGAAGDYVSPSYGYLAVHGEKTTPVIVPIEH